MKITICKSCGNTMPATNIKGEPCCLVCDGLSTDSGVPVEVDVLDTLTCDACHKQWLVSDILKKWIDIPFYNHHDKTFYDGCRGWS